jgi:hypothetical protein
VRGPVRDGAAAPKKGAASMRPYGKTIKRQCGDWRSRAT